MTDPVNINQVPKLNHGLQETDEVFITRQGSGPYRVPASSFPWQQKGDKGDSGGSWAPVLALVTDGVRRVHRIVGWVGGTGVEPTTTGYIGAAGIVSNIAEAVDVRGLQGNAGWAPVLALVADGDRRVHQVIDWTGGAGAKPGVGWYVGATGLVELIQDAVNVRGATGGVGWSPVLAVVPDGNRRVQQIVDWIGGAGAKPTTLGYVGIDGIVSTAASAVDVSGVQGDAGWAPVLAIVADGERRVQQVVDWVGGAGTKPQALGYVGGAGIVATAAAAVDVRGAQGVVTAGGFLGVLQDAPAVVRQEISSLISGDLLTVVPPAATVDVIKGVYVNSGWVYVRYPWSTTHDAVQMVRLIGTDVTANNPIDMYGVRLVPVATLHSAPSIASAFVSASGTSVIATQSDSIGPLNYNGTFIGANHGAFIAHAVNANSHGKTAADIGSEWTGPGGRKFYIFRIVSSNVLWMVSSNSGTAEKWVFYTTLLTGQTLTHSSGATSLSDIVVTADTLSQLTPCLSRRTLDVRIDGVSVAPSSVAAYSPGVFEILEGYSIVNPSAAVDYLKAAPGAGRSFFDDGIAVDVGLVNTHRWNSNGCRTTEQATTWFSAVTFFYQGVVQDIPPSIISGGALLQYVDGVNPIGGLDYRATVDITTSLTPFSATAATWAEAVTAPSRMAQIVTSAGVRRYGTVLGCSLLRGVTTRRKRRDYCNDALGIPSAALKKQYPRPVTKAPAPGDVYTIVCYHHTYNILDQAPDATVATWFRDGPDYVVVLDFHGPSARTRVILPTTCNFWSARLVESQAVSLLTSTVIDGGGIAVSCNAAYGFAIVRVSRI